MQSAGILARTQGHGWPHAQNVLPAAKRVGRSVCTSDVLSAGRISRQSPRYSATWPSDQYGSVTWSPPVASRSRQGEAARPRGPVRGGCVRGAVHAASVLEAGRSAISRSMGQPARQNVLHAVSQVPHWWSVTVPPGTWTAYREPGRRRGYREGRRGRRRGWSSRCSALAMLEPRRARRLVSSDDSARRLAGHVVDRSKPLRVIADSRRGCATRLARWPWQAVLAELPPAIHDEPVALEVAQAKPSHAQLPQLRAGGSGIGPRVSKRGSPSPGRYSGAVIIRSWSSSSSEPLTSIHVPFGSRKSGRYGRSPTMKPCGSYSQRVPR